MHPISSHWARYILELLFACILESHIELIAHLLMRGFGDVDTPWLRNAFQSSGNVDTITEDIIAVNQHVAEVDADPEQHSPILGHIGVPLGHELLD